MTDFTPGPWVKDKWGQLKSGNVSVDVHGVGLSNLQNPTNNAKANANLIAAAPEMYEALKDVKEAFIKRSGMVDAVEVAIAALAKAEGKT